MTRRTTAAVLATVLTGATLTTGLTAAGAPAQAAQRPRPADVGAPGVGDPYFPRDGNGGIDVQHYDIHDGYSFRTGRLSGRTKLRVVATQDLARFNLDFLLPVRSVTVDGQRAAWERVGDHELRITPRQPLADGSRFKVVVEYAGKPRDEESQGEANWLADSGEVVAMNEPHMATWWFPANDHPSDKATYDIAITATKKKQVVSNGTLVSRTTKHGRATTTWSSSEPMATYLAFFALGSYDVRTGSTDDIPWTVAVSRDAPPAQRKGAMELLLRSGSITSWLQSVLGDYPFSTTGGLITALPVGFALENQTRPTYPLVGPGATTLLVHELAHQWFGDSVSVATWREIWLNEGFASFMEHYWTETQGGASTQDWLTELYDERKGEADQWDLEIDDPGRDRIFDNQVYDRGAMALAALRHRIGDAAFWTTLRTWVEQRRYGNGAVGQFEALAEQVSGQDLDGFFKAWLSRGSVPARTAANGF